MEKPVARSFKGKIRAANDKISRRFRFWKQLTPGAIYMYYNVQTYSSLTPLGQSKPFHVEERTKKIIYIKGHMTKIAPRSIYGKNLKNLLRRYQKSMILKLGMLHQGREVYKVYVNDDPELNMTCFTDRSNLLAYAFEWENCYKVI